MASSEFGGTAVSRVATRAPRRPFRAPSALPGFGLAYGFTWLYLGLIILIPLGAVVLWAGSLGPARLLAIATEPRTLAALKLSFGLSLAAAALNAVFGLLLAWVLTRYDFPGRRLVDAAVDLPFALPTAVAGIALSAIYAPNGWVGALVPFKIAYTPLGVFVALVFIGLPFVVRTVQPVLADVDQALEEAAATLGAGRARTVFSVVLPILGPALLTGFALAFARAVGEYGSVIFIAGNIPYVSEIAPLLIVMRLEEFDYAGATAIATAMLALSFAILLLVNLIEAWSRRRLGHGR
ncbi:sulfate ABC transporter permease subunit CysT [Hansschlegelia beijingensis]|uniref:Sulfate transport system permease protein CysT n=1 Tax=Hansschlegelia beijingensis TaxID=1133344 RepID=A0A7W6D7J3_9HYPH|nr:sulfate ABC transporter permease subunit CysT [Hansschlegelia beijingensis]MBB3974623.1 sulfate transport system permease protein [Hansschlegelia beijingensis]